MKRMMLNLVGLLLVAGGFAAYGDMYAADLGNGKRLTMGVDAQMRWEYYDREAWAYGQNGVPQGGPAEQYLRVQERVWGKLELSPDAFFMARLANRWQYYSSREGENNLGTRTWEFPGEVIFDNLYLNMNNVAGVDGLSLCLGRQNVNLGNGMVVLEGTTADGGRTIYFDGLVATYKADKDTLKFLALYNDINDEYVIANDDERRLRYGDTWLFGPYWTHNFSETFKTDLYYLYTRVNDMAEVTNNDLAESIPGIRVFGSPHKQVDYSVEWAHQFGRINHNQDTAADMVDVRLVLKTPAETCMEPKLSLEYTYFSGDEASVNDDEGWKPLFDGYPIWREELAILGIMTNNLYGPAYWTNLHQYRAQVDLLLNPADEEGKNKLTFSTAFAVMQTDVDNIGNGSTYGNLISAFLDYTVNKNLNVSLQAAQFYPGNYYASGSTTEWLRLETNIKF